MQRDSHDNAKRSAGYAEEKFGQAVSMLVSPKPISQRLNDAIAPLLQLEPSSGTNIPAGMQEMYMGILDRLRRHESLSFEDKDRLCGDIFECFKELC